MAGPSVFFLYNLTARAQDIGILSISNPSKEVIALKHFSLPRGLVPLLALALVVVVSLCDKAPGREVTDLFERASKAR